MDNVTPQVNEARCHDPYLRCALYGAAQTALGITGCGVLAHSPQGCFQLVDTAFGWQDADYTETQTLCTKLCEDEIVHGGEDLLARTILEARELDVLIMFVVTACGPEIVGDDIDAGAFAPDFELIDGRGAEGVSRAEDNFSPAVLVPVGHFADGGGLA